MQEDKKYSRCLQCGNQHQIGAGCATYVSHFYWPHPAHQVFLVGEWSQWQHKQEMIKISNYFTTSVNLKTGVYTYKFIVDGKWTYNDISPTSPDNHGSFNNTIYVAPKTAYVESTDITNEDNKKAIIKIVSSLTGEDIRIVGSWDNWKSERSMAIIKNPFKDCEQSVIELDLQNGRRYEFKFKIKNQFLIDETYPSTRNEFGSLNNWIIACTNQYHVTPSIIRNNQNLKLIDYNLNSKEWVWQKITIQQFPFYNIYGHTLCNVGDFLYIFGGVAQGQFRNYLIKISAHNFVHCQVEQVEPDARAFHTGCVYGNKLLIFGGHNTVILQDYYCFNTYTNDWIAPVGIKGESPKIREKGSCILYKQMLIFFGGYYCSPDFEVEILYNDISVLDIEGMSWKKPPVIRGEAPPCRFSHTANLYGEFMLIFGGQYDMIHNKNLNDLWRLNLQSSHENIKWEEMIVKGKPPAPRHGHTANLLYHTLVIFGGYGDNNEIFNDITLLDLKMNQWIHPIISGDIPKPRYYHAACKLKSDEIVVFGGKTSGKRKDTKNENIYILKPIDINKVLSFDDDL